MGEYMTLAKWGHEITHKTVSSISFRYAGACLVNYTIVLLLSRQNEEGGGDEAESDEIALPSDIPWLAQGFPFTSASETRLQVRSYLLSHLPELGKARHLVDIYYRHCGWM